MGKIGGAMAEVLFSRNLFPIALSRNDRFDMEKREKVAASWLALGGVCI